MDVKSKRRLPSLMLWERDFALTTPSWLSLSTVTCYVAVVSIRRYERMRASTESLKPLQDLIIMFEHVRVRQQDYLDPQRP